MKLGNAFIAAALLLAPPAPGMGADELSSVKVAPSYRATVFASG